MTRDQLVAALERELLTWPGVSEEPGRFHSTVFRVGRREIGHIHGDGTADLPFPRTIRDELLASGRATPHRVGVPGYVSYALRQPEDIAAAVALFRLNYDRAAVSSDAA